MGIIYGYANPKGKILYVGQTVNLEQRHRKHCKHDPYNKEVLEYNYPLSRGIRKHGEEYYSLVILEENIDNFSTKFSSISLYVFRSPYNSAKTSKPQSTGESLYPQII